MILTVFCLIFYPLVIQYKRGGLWLALVPFTLVVLVVNVIANHTEWLFCFGKPPKGAYTISSRIKAMQVDTLHPTRAKFASIVQAYLDAFEPDGIH